MKRQEAGPLAEILIGLRYTTRTLVASAFEPHRDRLLFVMISELQQSGHDLVMPLDPDLLAFGQQLFLSQMANASRLILSEANRGRVAWGRDDGIELDQKLSESEMKRTLEGARVFLKELQLPGESGTIQLDIDGTPVNLLITAKSSGSGASIVVCEFQRQTS
jgi:hypothetical protein